MLSLGGKRKEKRSRMFKESDIFEKH